MNKFYLKALVLFASLVSAHANELPTPEEADKFAVQIVQQVIEASKSDDAVNKLTSIFTQHADFKSMTQQALKDILRSIKGTPEADKLNDLLARFIQAISLDVPPRYATPANIDLIKKAELKNITSIEEGPVSSKSQIVTLSFKQKSGADTHVKIEVSKVKGILKILSVRLDAFDLLDTVSKVYISDFKGKCGSKLDNFLEMLESSSKK